jgi:type II secretory pathway component PulM
MKAPTVGAPKGARRWWAAALAGVMVAALGLALVGAGAWFAVVGPLLDQRERDAWQAADAREALRREAARKANELAEAEARAEEERRRRADEARRVGEGSAPGDYPLPGQQSPVPRWERDPTVHPRE